MKPLKPFIAQVLRFRGWFAGSLAAGYFTVATNIGLLFTSAYLISKAAQRPSTILLLWVPIVGVRFFSTAHGVGRYVERYLSHELTFRVLTDLRVWFYRQARAMGVGLRLNLHSGELLSRAMADVDTLQNLYLRLLAPPLIFFLTLVTVIGILVPHGWGLALTLTVFLLAAGLAVPLWAEVRSREAGRDWLPLRARLSALIVDTVGGLGDLTAYGQARAQLARLEALNREQGRLRARGQSTRALSAGLLTLLSLGAAWALLTEGIPLVEAGRLPGVLLASVTLLGLASFEAVQPLPLAFQYLSQSREAGRRLQELTAGAPPEPADGVRVRWEGVPALEVRGLGLRYEEARWALEGVDLDLRPGRRVAVVGPTGSGKSSLLSVVAGLWPYQRGEVRLGGHELRRLDPGSLHAALAVAEQRPHLFNTTLRENLLLADPDADTAALERAARVAVLDEVVARLPEGYDTPIGEQGARLSGGEARRLAVARAVLKGAPVVLLDEPTEGLDATNAGRLMQRLLEWLGPRSLLLVTHLLTGLEAMDEIVVLDQGRVVERGTQAELLARNGYYRRLWESQQQRLGDVTDGPESVAAPALG
ncbi:Transport ATP-binding protein CydC [Candidatus Hydrogenisulfobacillus filiaventi]|uniref:Transport ATP-binding protein CydC n=1 Tax=Candidatus Hydrogenisulfobacillus filiaventi TaxID=2707344 RepID=A0A6F8ZFP0_9FIRM|nr:Transport ATP-binding protein CydC [Candidatus Hydrogenisulfobacillus filiaventi]